ncbi:tetratricopeptide repeat protein [Variovorax sp. ZS18.2.2]|uniref:tetratricopeptide repeat protein n=1 Tax=Variovorax sp. ZS18.2.2 TaxID=2971255 RepID=UPI00215086F2|nr:tetratricopeptide repeat protein [Variovorax sp. ZS18.2.2]MCR6475219.1 tetratricopeptide repeat protein [Variovorax sp. ZS18.2.2]
MNTMLTRIAIAATFALAAGHALAADMTPAPAPMTPAAKAAPASNLAAARALIADSKWTAAVSELERVNDTGNADWNNLMGYTLRKSGAGKWVASEKYYDAALKIDPKHLGALEYSGELYISMGDLPKAEQRLAALGQACNMNCPEYKDLKASVETFKASGGKKS